MNWYKKIQHIKTAQIQGEFWIDGHIAIGADSETNDYNHESYVIESVRYQLGDEKAAHDWEEFKKRIGQEQFNEEMINNQGDVKRINEIKEEYEKDADTLAYRWLQQNENATDEDILVAEGMGDARLYGMKNMGWKRIQDNNIETWALTKGDLNDIANGLFECYFDQVENKTFNIYVYSTKKLYEDVPYLTIEQASPTQLRDYMVGDKAVSGWGQK
ncbi:MAG: hypothetical protein ACOC5T_05290 [Elusimicrobiota bacterium]